MSSSNRKIKSNPKVAASEFLLYQNSLASSIQGILKPSKEMIQSIDNLTTSIKDIRKASKPLIEINEAFQSSSDIIGAKEKIEKATQPLRRFLESTIGSAEFQETVNYISLIADDLEKAAQSSKNIAIRFKNEKNLSPNIREELREIEDASNKSKGNLDIFKRMQQSKPTINRKKKMQYKSTNLVFINCPFDPKYLNLFHAIVFTIYDCGFIPRCTLEEDDSSEVRLEKIIKLINACRYGIHDISRVELDETTKLPRFNMPFELGIFIGLKSIDKKKKCLVLDSEPYQYRNSISDIAGVDISGHNNIPEEIIKRIRKWLVTNSKRTTIPNYKTITERYYLFDKELKNIHGTSGTCLQEIPFIELSFLIESWLRSVK